MMKANTNEEIRFCKNCGCELVSTNKHNLCDHCRRTRNEKIRNELIGVGTGLLSIGLFVITKGKRGGKE